jgi:hypothetical protein
MSADVATKKIQRGKGWHNTGAQILSANYGGTEYEGTIRTFEDQGPSTTANQPLTRRSAGQVTCILVRNVSGINLLPGRMVTWKAGFRGKRVDGYSTTTACEVAGVVDEYWPAAGVPDGELFWLVVRGHTLVRNDLATGGAAINAGDRLVALTAITSQCTTAGRIVSIAGTFSAAETTDGTAINVLTNWVGRAVSAKTSANTNNQVLVEFDSHFVGQG